MQLHQLRMDCTYRHDQKLPVATTNALRPTTGILVPELVIRVLPFFSALPQIEYD